jgi:hypothetical protein
MLFRTISRNKKGIGILLQAIAKQNVNEMSLANLKQNMLYFAKQIRGKNCFLSCPKFERKNNLVRHTFCL